LGHDHHADGTLSKPGRNAARVAIAKNRLCRETDRDRMR
jgi:hypothetical protein